MKKVVTPRSNSYIRSLAFECFNISLVLGRFALPLLTSTYIVVIALNEGFPFAFFRISAFTTYNNNINVESSFTAASQARIENGDNVNRTSLN